MKTQVMTFKINKPYEHWDKTFDSHKKIQATAGMIPLFGGLSEDYLRKGLYCSAHGG
tara:strand:+ start:629 stop:799 length:171 start_codon:yes stop_codon:yes gene_type:complete